jgi:hypothetical protein
VRLCAAIFFFGLLTYAAQAGEIAGLGAPWTVNTYHVNYGPQRFAIAEVDIHPVDPGAELDPGVLLWTGRIQAAREAFLRKHGAIFGEKLGPGFVERSLDAKNRFPNGARGLFVYRDHVGGELLGYVETTEADRANGLLPAEVQRRQSLRKGRVAAVSGYEEVRKPLPWRRIERRAHAKVAKAGVPVDAGSVLQINHFYPASRRMIAPLFIIAETFGLTTGQFYVPDPAHRVRGSVVARPGKYLIRFLDTPSLKSLYENLGFEPVPEADWLGMSSEQKVAAEAIDPRLEAAGASSGADYLYYQISRERYVATIKGLLGRPEVDWFRKGRVVRKRFDGKRIQRMPRPG